MQTGNEKRRALGSLALSMCLGATLVACEADPPEPRFYRERPKDGASAEPRGTRDSMQKAAEAAAQPAPPPRPARPGTPDSPDPAGGKFTLEDATRGLPGKGTLYAKIETSLGNLECKLYADKAPLTVANFVGLARGERPFWDAKQGAWVKRPLYDGTTFHRVIEGFMIQGGDHMGTGAGDTGYNLQDEIWPGTTHDRAGLLCMANRGPNTNGGQFFITDAAAPHLTQMGTYTNFGECSPVENVHRIAQAPKSHPGSERPEPAITINKVTITRR
ncbi:MAG: peptidylprolyl isomerase [Myxococcales bacterium]